MDEDSIREISIPESNEPITTRTNENVIDGPTPIGTSEILKLENEVDKTIENANNVLDVPLRRPYQQEDKILEEIVHMISNAPEEVTSNSNDIPITTITMKAPVTVTYHHAYNEPDENEKDESLLTTLFEEIFAKSTIDAIARSTMTPLTNAPEAETIFPLINNIHNNEHYHHNAFDEKLPIVIATAAVS